ncbi:MAG: hypothetical protein ABGW97_15910 [Christiangramia sp.]|uniref:hypothetical protein n=1 Tax=Christiangramia sp. TaxID=1931228 RepID=UPI003241DBC1
MKIELKLSEDTLMAANKVLRELWEMPVSTDERENVFRSIGYDLAQTFETRVKAQIRKANLFDNSKPLKMTLKFHEAWALEAILNDLTHQVITNPYQLSILRKLTNDLNQKLA